MFSILNSYSELGLKPTTSPQNSPRPSKYSLLYTSSPNNFFSFKTLHLEKFSNGLTKQNLLKHFHSPLFLYANTSSGETKYSFSYIYAAESVTFAAGL